MSNLTALFQPAYHSIVTSVPSIPYTPSQPPGTAGIVTILGWIAWIGFAAAAGGVMICGIKMMGVHKRGESAEGATKLLWVFAGLAVVSGAGGLITALS